VTLAAALAHFRAIASAVRYPVNGDFEGGFAIAPQDVAENFHDAGDHRRRGLSIEDSTGDPNDPLFEFSLAVERVHAAREAIDRSGTGVVLTGRSEGFIVGRPDLEETIRRLRRLRELPARTVSMRRASARRSRSRRW
jgi:2-methylisocitrate lyase-like PEP mutase family enzyme